MIKFRKITAILLMGAIFCSSTPCFADSRSYMVPAGAVAGAMAGGKLGLIAGPRGFGAGVLVGMIIGMTIDKSEVFAKWLDR